MSLLKSRSFRGNLEKVMWITFAWTIISVFQFFTGYVTVQQLGFDVESHNPKIFLVGSIITGLAAGLLGGGFIVFVWEKWLRDKKYNTALFHIFLSYSVIYFLVSLTGGLFFYSQQLGENVTNPMVANRTWEDIFQFHSIHNFMFWLCVVIATLIALLVNDKYGPGVFKKFLLGKYFHPVREERIFMFMDLRSSTTIAEKLGEEVYFNFIREVFRDVTPAILKNRGEIYQYVGDEIVISWKIDQGIQETNCLECYFDAQAALNKRKSYYQNNYDGVQPEFKAGLHYGFVMAGEVGVVKREIAYSGDVLNTAARIQSKCNEHGVNILLSKYLLDKLHIDSSRFNPKMVGDILLRGKLSSVSLYTL